MSKPNVFFSHSSQDRIPLNRLKDIFLEKIGSTVNIFLSSDGQSIPFGKNWVKEVENALQDCKIMFVFLTPASIHSNWIYFEAGHAYSKGIKVIPVGFLGMDLNSVKPPLSLLQGFNIINEKGLDNIIAIINEEFDFQHKSLFTGEEYQKICEKSRQAHCLGEYGWYLDTLQIKIKNEGFKHSDKIAQQKKSHKPEPIKILDNFFDSQNLEYTRDRLFDLNQRMYYLPGITISITDLEFASDIILYVDPFSLEKNSELVATILKQIRDEGVKGLPLIFLPSKEISCLTEWHKITGRIQDDLIKLDEKTKALIYKDLYIQIYLVEVRNKEEKRKKIPVLNLGMKEDYIPINQIQYVLNKFAQFGILYPKSKSLFY